MTPREAMAEWPEQQPSGEVVHVSATGEIQPNELGFILISDVVAEADYIVMERMYKAALVRLRVAVEALSSLGQSLGCKFNGEVVSVSQALAAIGPLPP